MTQEEIQNFIAQEVSRQVQREMEKVDNFMKIDKYIFDKLTVFMDGRNIQAGRTTGTRIGTATDQKFAFYGVTPVVQAGAISAPSTPSGVYSSGEAQSAVNAINSIRTALKNFGIIA